MNFNFLIGYRVGSVSRKKQMLRNLNKSPSLALLTGLILQAIAVGVTLLACSIPLR